MSPMAKHRRTAPMSHTKTRCAHGCVRALPLPALALALAFPFVFAVASRYCRRRLAASSSAAASPRRGLWLIAAICWPPAGLCIRAHIGGVDAEALPHGGPAAAGDDPHRSAEQGVPADHSTGVSVRRERWLDLSRQRLLNNSNNIHTSRTRTAPPLTRLTVVAVRRFIGLDLTRCMWSA